MIRMLLALAVLGIVIVTTMRMFSSQLGGVARITGADIGGGAASAPSAAVSAAPVTPRATVDQAAQAVQQALQQGAAAQAARASEAGN